MYGVAQPMCPRCYSIILSAHSPYRQVTLRWRNHVAELSAVIGSPPPRHQKVSTKHSGVFLSRPQGAPTSPNSRAGSLLPLGLPLDSGWSARPMVHTLSAAPRKRAEQRLGLQTRTKCTVGFVNWPLPLYRFVPLVKDATGRLKQNSPLPFLLDNAHFAMSGL